MTEYDLFIFLKAFLSPLLDYPLISDDEIKKIIKNNFEKYFYEC